MHPLAVWLDRLGSPRILVVGDLILDRYTWGQVHRISPEGPIPVLKVEREEVRLGGAGAVLVNLAELGARVTALGVLGNDPEGDLFLAQLEQQGIDAGGVVRTDERPTTVKTRFLARTQQILRVDAEQDGPFPEAIDAELRRRALELIGQADLVLISDYAKGVLKGGLLEAIRQWRYEHRDTPVLVDPSRRPDFDPYRGFTTITPNRDETEMATGIRPLDQDSTRAAGQRLVNDLGLDYVVITLDRDGMAVVDGEGSYQHYPTQPVKVYDVTGAGDMVISVLGLVLAGGGPVTVAVQLANRAGGLEVQRVGVSPLSRQEIRATLYDISDETKVVGIRELVGELLEVRKQGKRVVFTNGCFDVLHVGHIKLLEAARDLGDMLVVGLNSDTSVRTLKGPQRPILDEEHRSHLLAALEAVDRVVLFDEETPLELIRAIQPEVLVKGEDYRNKVVVGREIVEAAGGKVELVPLVVGISTSEIVRRIKAAE